MDVEERQKDNLVVEVVSGLLQVGKEKAVEMVVVVKEVGMVRVVREVKMVAAAVERMEKKEKVAKVVAKVKEEIEAEEASGYHSREEILVEKT